MIPEPNYSTPLESEDPLLNKEVNNVSLMVSNNINPNLNPKP